MLTVHSLQGSLPVSITMKEMFALLTLQNCMLHLPHYFQCLMFVDLSLTTIWKLSSHVYSLARQRCKAVILKFGGRWLNAIFTVICFPYGLSIVLHNYLRLKRLGSGSLHI